MRECSPSYTAEEKVYRTLDSRLLGDVQSRGFRAQVADHQKLEQLRDLPGLFAAAMAFQESGQETFELFIPPPPCGQLLRGQPLPG